MPARTSRGLDPVGGSSPTLTPVPLGKGPGALADYRFSVVLDYRGHRAQVTQIVEVVNPGPDTWDRLVFHLPYDLRTSRFTLSRVSLEEQAVTTAPAIQTDNDGFLTVSLPNRLAPNAAVLVNITYGLVADQTTLAARRPFGDVGYSDRLVQFVNWYPRLVPYRPGRGWQVWTATEVGPPLFAEVADYELEVQTTEGVLIASGGPASREGTSWRFRLQNARSIAFSASPEYQVTQQTEGATSIFVYYLPEYGFEAEAVLTAAKQALVLFNDRFGPYPHDTLLIAQNAYLPSVAVDGFVLHTGQGFAEYTGQPDTLLIVLVPMTMAQLWWGQVVGYDPIAEPWLGAALPMYAEFLYDQAYHPGLQDWYWQNRIFYWDPRGPLNQTAYDLETTEALLRNVFRQGALFLHDVRNTIGDDAFFAFLRDFYRNGAYKIVNRDDFFNALSRNATSDLNPTLDKYFDVSIVLPTLAPTLTPIPSPGPPPTATPPARVHVVQAGETLSEIAFKNGVTVKDIMDLNGLRDSETIVVGQRLVLP